MNMQSSGVDLPHFLYPSDGTGTRSMDLYDIAVNYTLQQCAITNTMCPKYQSSPHSNVPFSLDTLPLHYHTDSDYMRRMQVRDNTSPLKLWLLQHKKNPYPSKPEKIMLAILARMTLTQVSTWFANARRRLKRDYPDVEYIGAENGTYCGTDIHVM